MALVGKPCPSIAGLTFIKGQPVAIPSPGAPMVIEFWATWCGPCRVAFPHLSQLAQKHRSKGLVVLGVNMEEDSPQIRAFVQQQGAKMDYTVAVDGSGQAAQALMGAAGVSGIPHAFIVDASGTIRHHGHPMEPRFAQLLDQVCSQAAPAAAAGAAGGSGAAASPPKQERQLPPVTAGREELMAMPVRQLKQILEERSIGLCPIQTAHAHTTLPPRCWPAWHPVGAGFGDLSEKGELVDRILQRCSNVTYYAS